MKSRPDTIFRTVTWPRLENRSATGSSIGRPAGVEGGLAILQLPASRASIPIPSFRGIPMRGCRIFSRSTRSFHWNETLALLNASEEEQERRVVQILMNRKIRDASFRRQVCQAYDNTCAITGLRMVNGRRQGRSAGRAHLVRCDRRTRCRAKRTGIVSNRSLAVRPALDFARRRLRLARLAQSCAGRIAVFVRPTATAHSLTEESGHLAAPPIHPAAPCGIPRLVGRP